MMIKKGTLEFRYLKWLTGYSDELVEKIKGVEVVSEDRLKIILEEDFNPKDWRWVYGRAV